MNNIKLKQILKKNKLIDAISRIIFYPVFFYQMKKSDNDARNRARGYADSRYNWINDLKDTHKNERCFIVATGPSLKMEDLELIKDEFSFGMNSVIKAFGETEWRPNIYMIQDEYVYEKMENELSEISKREKFLIAAGGVVPEKFVSAKSYLPYAIHYLDHKMFHMKGYGSFKFSNDSYNVIYDAYTVTFSALQMAVHMGFKEIYLLGCDCNYNLSKSHFVDYGHKDPKAAIMGDKMITGHYEFQKFADSIGVMVVNCTRGGMLEAYPRMQLEDVLKERK